MLLTHILLALSWVAVTGELTAMNLVWGLLLGYVVLWLSAREGEQRTYVKLLPRALGLLLYFLKELVVANARVAQNIIEPPEKLSPAIVAVPLDLHGDAAITLLANLVTLTPGTLSLDVSEDRKILYVHVIHVTDPEAFRREVKGGFERMVAELFE